MGAGPSIASIYRHAVVWFKNFIDKELYHAMFEEMNVSADGGLNYMELQCFLTKRLAACNKQAKEGIPGPWQIFNLKGPVIMMAHKMASTKLNADHSTSVSARKQVDYTEMRAMLIQLYAFGIIWRHFVHAKHWEGNQDDPNDSTLQLSLPEFIAACRSLAHCHGGEELSDAVLMEDFADMDTNFTSSVGYVTICHFCGKYILPANNSLLRDMNEKLGKNALKIPKFFGKVAEDASECIVTTTANKMFHGMTNLEKENLAFIHMGDSIEREETKIVQFYEGATESYSDCKGVVSNAATFQSKLSIKVQGKKPLLQADAKTNNDSNRYVADQKT